MNVKDLIEKLSTLNPMLPVWVAEDAEGNGFEDLNFVRTESVNLYDYSVVHEDDVDDYEEGVLTEAVVLWP